MKERSFLKVNESLSIGDWIFLEDKDFETITQKHTIWILFDDPEASGRLYFFLEKEGNILLSF